MIQRKKVTTTMASPARVNCARMKCPSMESISSTVSANIRRLRVSSTALMMFWLSFVSVFEKENGQDRDQEQPPHILDRLGCAQT